jgi:hypothetical protein
VFLMHDLNGYLRWLVNFAVRLLTTPVLKICVFCQNLFKDIKSVCFV